MLCAMLASTYNPETDPHEASRAVGVMLRTGTVAQVDHKAARLRFKTGGITTDWLPWIERRAGGTNGGRTWWPPVAGEQGMLLAPGGDLGRAFVLLGAFSDAMPAPSQEPQTARGEWNGTDFWQWQRGELRVQCARSITLQVGQSSITVRPDGIHLSAAGASLSLAAGIVAASRDVVAGGISLIGHVHGGVRSGGSTTGAPT